MALIIQRQFKKKKKTENNLANSLKDMHCAFLMRVEKRIVRRTCHSCHDNDVLY